MAIAIKKATTIDVDVVAAKLKKGGCVLKDLLESIGLPIVGVVGELNIALDICKMSASGQLELKGALTQVNVVQICQV